MTQAALPVGQSPRALILGPAFTAAEIGGMPVALSDVAGQLRARGWEVDLRIWVAPAANAAAQASGTDWAVTAPPPELSLIERHPALFSAWISVAPAWLRSLVSPVVKPRSYLESLSHNLAVAEGLLAQARAYDVVLLCVDGAPPGLAALLTDRLERVVMVSLIGLALEIKSGSFRWERFVARRRLGGQAHPYLYRPTAAGRVRLALFASAHWRSAAVRAGLAPGRARTIYFGIPLTQLAPRPNTAQHRILMVGRLAPEKGAHLLLRALPAIRAAVSDATVTIIAGPGPTGYRRLLQASIQRQHLDEVVTILPSMQRQALQAAYAAYDALFFYSMFAEPVALVLMEAYAAGIPVAASQAHPDSALVRDQVTCLCYQPNDAASLATAMISLLTDTDLSGSLAANAQRLVREEFSLEAMGQAYDSMLRGFIGT